MNKFGAAYTVFEDCIELLPYSIRSIRDSVDFISVVYQHISNQGRKTTTNYEAELIKLKEEGLIDDLSFFTPRDRNPHVSEVAKRNQGRSRCLNAGCTYFMSMDADEFYKKDEFEYMKKAMVEGDFDAGYCQLLSFYKTTSYVLDPPEDYYVSLMYKMTEKQFVMMAYAPVLVDPTRRIIATNPKIFRRDEIQMYHMTYVRKDIRQKLENSSALVNYANKVEEIVNDWKNFDGKFANIAGNRFPVKKIEPYFTIEI